MQKKKTGLLLLAAITVLLSWAGPGLNGKAEAASIEDIREWVDGETIWDWDKNDKKGDETPYLLHDVDLSPLLVSEINSITLSITYEDNLGNMEGNSELWRVYTEDGISIGQLDYNAKANDPDTDTFYLNLTQNLLDEIMGTDPWNLTLYLDELSTGNARIDLFSLILTVDYTPIPIPGSALLLGSGVLCLIVIGRRRRTKKE